jgi:hypothetical protein
LGDGISEKHRAMPSPKNDTQAVAVQGKNKVHLTMPTDETRGRQHTDILKDFLVFHLFTLST